MTDVNKLVDSLIKLQTKAEQLINEVAALADEASATGGKVADVLPLNLKKCVDILADVAFGEQQYSFDNLIDYIDNIPIGELRRKPVYQNGVNVQRQEHINTTPNTNMAPQSSIARESSALERFYKDSFKETAKKEINPNWSFDEIKESFSSRADALEIEAQSFSERAMMSEASNVVKSMRESADRVFSNEGLHIETKETEPLKEATLSDWVSICKRNASVAEVTQAFN